MCSISQLSTVLSPLTEPHHYHFFQQLDDLWKRPVHAHSIALHEVKTPPPDLDLSADVTFLYEQAPDRNRQAAATDQLVVLLDIEIYSQGESSPGTHLRRVVWSRRLVNRQAILSLTASVSLCEVPGTTCELSINHHIWPEEDTAQLPPLTNLTKRKETL